MKTTFIILVIVLAGWDAAWYFAGVRPMFPWQLKQHTKEYTLIDVRTPWEYSRFHIKEAVNRPDLLASPEPAIDFEPGKPVVVICMSGHRSPLVVRRLQERGVTDIYNLTWGMLGWKLAGGKAVRGKG